MNKRRNPHALRAWELNGGIHRRSRGGERQHLSHKLRAEIEQWSVEYEYDSPLSLDQQNEIGDQKVAD